MTDFTKMCSIVELQHKLAFLTSIRYAFNLYNYCTRETSWNILDGISTVLNPITVS